MSRVAEAVSFSIAARVHGTYLIAAEDSPKSPLLVGFHGYGETAERHLEELVKIPGAQAWTVAAVQALHPFYTRTNQVVASWMTHFDRERAIADNTQYAVDVIAALRLRGGVGPLVVVGFSQGAAMAFRAAAGCQRAGFAVAGVVALGGDVPPDVAAAGLGDFPPVLLGGGLSETWYTPTKLEHDRALLAAAGVRVEAVSYQGGHEWTDEFRGRAGEFLAAASRRD